ncbi:hypothetical protein DWU95_42290, partial [Burkholderia contaminans]
MATRAGHGGGARCRMGLVDGQRARGGRVRHPSAARHQPSAASTARALHPPTTRPQPPPTNPPHTPPPPP